MSADTLNKTANSKTESHNLRWIKKMWYIYMQWNIMQLLKKNKIMSFVETRVDLESVILSEISQMEEEKYCMASLICGI